MRDRKSTVLAALAERSITTIDTDDGDWIEVVDGDGSLARRRRHPPTAGRLSP